VSGAVIKNVVRGDKDKDLQNDLIWGGSRKSGKYVAKKKPDWVRAFVFGKLEFGVLI
jgi:hypothetical protein